MSRSGSICSHIRGLTCHPLKCAPHPPRWNEQVYRSPGITHSLGSVFIVSVSFLGDFLLCPWNYLWVTWLDMVMGVLASLRWFCPVGRDLPVLGCGESLTPLRHLLHRVERGLGLVICLSEACGVQPHGGLLSLYGRMVHV